MALVDIDEGELARLRAVNSTVAKMLQNPKTRTKVLELQKLNDPSVSIPELDAVQPALEASAALQAELTAFRQERAEEKAAREAEKVSANARSEWEKGRSTLRREGWNDEGVQKIEEFMEKRGIADHEVAAIAFEKLHPPTQPVAGSSNRFDLFAQPNSGADELKALFEGKMSEDAFANVMTQKTLADVRGGRV